jgi:hypothetical protein
LFSPKQPFLIGRFRRKMAARELGTLNSFQEKS